MEVICSKEFFSKGLVTHVLPLLLGICPSLPPLLGYIRRYNQDLHCEPVLRAIICILKTARKARVISSQSIIDLSTSMTCPFPMIVLGTQMDLISALEHALCHENELICADALEFVCWSPKETEEPSELELRLFKLFLSQNLKSSNPSFRQEVFMTVKKFLLRMRDSVKKRKRQKETKYLDGPSDLISWFNNQLFSNMYPGSPFARQQLSLQLFCAFTDVWGNDPQLMMEQSILFSYTNTLTLLFCLWNRFDSTRELAYQILVKFPAPLPGFEDQRSFLLLSKTALQLVRSPRTRECETAAFTLILLLNKYVKEKQWTPSIDTNEVHTHESKEKGTILSIKVDHCSCTITS